MLVGVIVWAAAAVSASSAAAADSVPDCNVMYNIGFLLYDDILTNHRDSIAKCMGYSKLDQALREGRSPSRAELGLFFQSNDCRQVANLLLAKIRENGNKCTLGALTTELGQLASLPFDEVKAVYAQFLAPSTGGARLL